SIPQPLYGLLGAFAISVLRSPDERRQFGNCKRSARCLTNGKWHVPPLRPETSYGAIERARPQKNRAPVPGIPGLQQSQFATLGDTETTSDCHAKGRPSLNKAGQV